MQTIGLLTINHANPACLAIGIKLNQPQAFDIGLIASAYTLGEVSGFELSHNLTFEN